MKMMIKGIDVTLITKEKIGTDGFGSDIFEEKEVIVENVLVVPSSTDDIVTAQNLTGKNAVYTLAIPKGDKNKWEDNDVIFFGQRWHVLGFAIEGIKENIPLLWNKKIMVERYG